MFYMISSLGKRQEVGTSVAAGILSSSLYNIALPDKIFDILTASKPY